jgi:hypothetical protein
MEKKIASAERTVYSDDFDKSMYMLHWYQLPSDPLLVNKHVTVRADRNHPDPVNDEMAIKMGSAYSHTYGKGIDPSSVPDLLEALKYLVDTYSQKIISWPVSKNPWDNAKAAISKSIIKQ